MRRSWRLCRHLEFVSLILFFKYIVTIVCVYVQDQELSEKDKMEKCMHLTGHNEYKHEESEEDVARREAQDLINKMQDPRYQARDKMHYLQEAYQKFNGPGGDKLKEKLGGGGSQTEEDKKEYKENLKTI